MLAGAFPAVAIAQAPAASGQTQTDQAQTGQSQPMQSQPMHTPAAQTKPVPMHAGGLSGKPHHAGASAVPNGRGSPELTERRIDELHARLHITPAQASQWNSFAQLMRGNARDLAQALEQRASGLSTMSAVESMRTYADIEQIRAQDLQKLAGAFQDLYATFSDQQKQEADQLFRNAAQPHMKHGGGKH
jgi:hypothetical protein